ncbi:urease accessory protein UreD [Roseomonas sp. NAR14]|uniref:Urease accessory protein UreD n=1 Tax=Roseomonas acroporae TaxID=2937791 RepID=A0A9X1YF01_9PROT|nr:urease accessory protein UreD [Roseomonas acroporae]MCK8785026.1 urease accessory protein UreD [Roseomonas acroporae]
MPDSPAQQRAPHQRSDGVAELGFARREGRTVLAHLHQQAPLRVLFPTPEPDEPPLGALVNTAGGLAGGDSLRVAVTLGAGATATASTPAAEKLYRSLGPETRVGTTLRVAAGATLEWLPQETILFDGARLRRRLDADLAADARLLAVEMLVFGRAARGERFARGALHDSWRLRVDGALRWADALRLPDTPEAALAHRFGFGGAGAMATLLHAAPDAATLLPLLREAAGPLGAATIPREGVLLARWLGPATAVRAALSAAIPPVRAALGLPGRLPRLWTT